MQILRIIKSFFCGSFYCAVALTAASSAAFAVTSTEVLPKGVRALGLVYVEAPRIDSTFNNNGNQESLARTVNRSVTMDDIQSAEPRLKTLRSILNSVSPENYGDKVVLSNLYSDVKVRERRYVTGLLYGISKNVSAGVIVPYIVREVQADFRVDTTNNAKAIENEIGNATPQVAAALDEIDQMKFDAAFYEERLFRANGYKPLAPYRATGLGDVQAEARVKYFESERLNLGFRSTLTLPTATHKADITNLLDRDFGDSTYAIRLGSLHSLSIFPDHFYFQSGIFGTYRAPTQQTLAVARTSADNLPNLNDPYQIESVDKKLGAQLDTDAGFNLDLWRGELSLFSSYLFSWKAEDEYKGNRGLDYGRIGSNTRVISHTVESGVEFSSVPLYLAKKSPVPGKLTFTWSQPVGGQNGTYSPYGRVDAILFF